MTQDNTIYTFFIKIYFSRLKQGKKKRMLFNDTRQYNIQFFYKNIFFKIETRFSTRQIKTTETNCELLFLIETVA